MFYGTDTVTMVTVWSSIRIVDSSDKLHSRTAAKRRSSRVRKIMQYRGSACVFILFVSTLLVAPPSCRAYPAPEESADSEDGYHFREDYPDALQITCTAPVRSTPCATGPADRKPRARPSDCGATKCPRAVPWCPRCQDDTTILFYKFSRNGCTYTSLRLSSLRFLITL